MALRRLTARTARQIYKPAGKIGLTFMVQTRPLQMDDFTQWLPLWQENCLQRITPDVTSQTWARLTDNANTQVNGIGAFKGDTLLGFAHYIAHPTTGALRDAAYLQDVFVTPDSRGQGLAKKLVNAVIKQAKAARYSRLLWLAEKDNKAAQNLYKTIANPIDFTVHLLPL